MHLQEVVGHLWGLWFLWLPIGLTRITQVVLFERILDAPRRRWLKRVNPENYQKGDHRLSLLAYVSMCIFCMSLDLGLLVMFLLLIPFIGELVVLVLVAAAASWFVPILDHLGDKLLKDQPLVSETEREAWDATRWGPPAKSLMQAIAAQQIEQAEQAEPREAD